MGSTFTDNGGIEKIGLGEQAGSWGTTTNTNFDIIDRLINGVGAIALSGTTHTLTTSDGSLSDGMFKVLVLGGSPSGTNTITISPNNADKLYFVKNGTSQTATFTQGSGGNVSIAAGKGAIIFADGAGSGAAVTDLTALFTTSQAIDGVNIGATTPGTGAFTALTVDNVVVNGANIGHTDDTDLITLANGAATVAGQLTATGDLATSGTVIPSGDTASGDNAAIGFTSAEGIIITGQGSTNDVTIKNDADTTVIAIPTGGTGVSFAGTITTPSITIGSTALTATAAELNLLDGGTSVGSSITVADADGIVINDGGTMKTIPASDIKTYATAGATSGTVTGVTGTDPIVSDGSSTTPTISIKNDFIQNTSSAISSNSTTSFTASTYPTFISARTTSTGNPSWTITIGGSATSHSTADGDSGTFDSIQFLLPVGGTLACSTTFSYFAFQIRPG